MPLTPAARRLAQTLADAAIGLEKTRYRDRLLSLQEAFDPPLRNSELSSGLGLVTPPEGQPGISDVGRFVSEAPRLRRSRPDSATRALIDAIVEGGLLIAARVPAEPGARREVIVALPSDLPWLSRNWQVRDLSGRTSPIAGEAPAPGPTHHATDDLDDDALWDPFGGGRGTSPAAIAVRQEQPGSDSEAGAHTPSPAAAPGRPIPAPGSDVPNGSPLAAVSGDGVRPPTPRVARLGDREVPRIGLGTMRLSTLPDRLSAAEATRLVHAALDAGMRLLDTADSYCLDGGDVGHSERLLAAALRTWSGPRDEVLIATKGGLLRPGGRWIPNGHPDHLRAACEASLLALGLEAHPLYQLHAVDRRVPLAESVGALAQLVAEGKIARVGLCNVDLEQLETALEITPIVSVQNELSAFQRKSFQTGLVARCRGLGIAVIAHRPLGGHAKSDRAARDAALSAVAARHGATPHQVALAWLLGMGPHIVAIPGATRIERLDANLGAVELRLTDGDLRELDAARRGVAEARAAIWAAGGVAATGRSSTPPASPEGEGVVIISGSPAAGKTSRVRDWEERGFLRLNRDTTGGKLADLLPLMAARIAAGERRFVLDNTYPTRKTRAPLLSLAARHGLPAVGVHIDISREDALFNAAGRVLERMGRLPSPDELAEAGRGDPNMFPPIAVHQYFARHEEPDAAEGYERLERVTFERRAPPNATRRAVILDYDGTLRRSRGPAPFPRDPSEVELLPNRRQVLDRYAAEGWLLLGVSNQAGIAQGDLDETTARATFEHTNTLLGHAIDVRFCPHPAGRIRCWCRKPMPGFGVQLIREYGLDRGQCIYVGDRPSDREFAANCGFQYADAADFFA